MNNFIYSENNFNSGLNVVSNVVFACTSLKGNRRRRSLDKRGSDSPGWSSSNEAEGSEDAKSVNRKAKTNRK